MKKERSLSISESMDTMMERIHCSYCPSPAIAFVAWEHGLSSGTPYGVLMDYGLGGTTCKRHIEQAAMEISGLYNNSIERSFVIVPLKKQTIKQLQL